MTAPTSQPPVPNAERPPVTTATGSSRRPVIAHLDHVTKVYGEKTTSVVALRDVTVDFYAGQFTSIMGPSGSGKSTLLHALAGLDTITEGAVYIDNRCISQLGDKQLTQFRRDHVGFVFQSFNLIPTLDARANIELPLRLAGKKPDRGWFDQVTSALGLTDRLSHKPYELSGGQQQRVAVARALVSRPALLVADEPTGNLDSAASAEVLSLLRQAVDQLGQTVIMVTHDRHAAAVADRVLVVKDGRIEHDLDHPNAKQIAEVA